MINTVIQGDCLEMMKQIPDSYIDLTVTSPPYDNLRTYNDSLDWGEHVWKPVIQDLYRVTKDGGVVVWVVGDATIKGSETGTSFRQALYFKEIGFNLHDTMIYMKANPVPNNANRYTPCFEYMFVFSKGNPKTFNAITAQCKYAGKKASRTVIDKEGERKHQSLNGVYQDNKKVSNIFIYNIGTLADVDFKHPAKFPAKLAEDHILSWSNEGDTVLDPFAGSGTTGVACQNTGRNYILIEKEPEYVEIIKKRLA